MSKKKPRNELDKVPEQRQQKPKKKDKLAELVEEVKKKYNIDVELARNVKYKIEKVINHLNKNYEFRYNVINTDTEYRPVGSKEWLYFDDRDYSKVFIDLKHNNISVSDMDFKNIIKNDDITIQYNPFREYFNSIPKWDGKRDYIVEFLSQITLKDEKKSRVYFVNGFKKWFVGLVLSLLEDEPSMFNVNQTCLVLVGAQGKYKTTLLKNIVPKALQLKYFYGSSFIAHNKDHEKYLAYKMIINLDEMAAMNKTDIETIKSKITQDQVVVRLPYAKADTHLKRRASFTGTQNNIEFLRDDTGSRRWFVVEIENITINEEFDIDMMYAQGYAMYKEHYKHWFDAEDIEAIELHNEPFQLKDMMFEMVQKHYTIPTDDEIKEKRTDIHYSSATDIANDLATTYNKLNVNNTVVKSIGTTLRKLGFKKRSRRCEGYESPVPLWCVKKVFEPKNYDPEEPEGLIAGDMII